MQAASILKTLMSNLCHNLQEGQLPPKNFQVTKTLSLMKMRTKNKSMKIILKMVSMLLKANLITLQLSWASLLIQKFQRVVVDQRRQSNELKAGSNLPNPPLMSLMQTPLKIRKSSIRQNQWIGRSIWFKKRKSKRARENHQNRHQRKALPEVKLSLKQII